MPDWVGQGDFGPFVLAQNAASGSTRTFAARPLFAVGFRPAKTMVPSGRAGFPNGNSTFEFADGKVIDGVGER